MTETGIAFIKIARGLLQARDDAIAALIAIERGEIHSLNLGSASCLNRELFTVARDIHTELVQVVPFIQFMPHLHTIELILAKLSLKS